MSVEYIGSPSRGSNTPRMVPKELYKEVKRGSPPLPSLPLLPSSNIPRVITNSRMGSVNENDENAKLPPTPNTPHGSNTPHGIRPRQPVVRRKKSVKKGGSIKKKLSKFNKVTLSKKLNKKKIKK